MSYNDDAVLGGEVSDEDLDEPLIPLEGIDDSESEDNDFDKDH